VNLLGTELGDISAAVVAAGVCLGIIGGIVGLWVDARITAKLKPIYDILSYEHKHNGGVHRNGNGELDGTQKDLATANLERSEEILALLKERND
jgi:hypothetical protein